MIVTTASWWPAQLLVAPHNLIVTPHDLIVTPPRSIFARSQHVTQTTVPHPKSTLCINSTEATIGIESGSAGDGGKKSPRNVLFCPPEKGSVHCVFQWENSFHIQSSRKVLPIHSVGRIVYFLSTVGIWASGKRALSPSNKQWMS